jgi:hypothetical protein
MRNKTILSLGLLFAVSQSVFMEKSLRSEEKPAQIASDEIETHLKRIRHLYRPYQTIKLSYHSESFDNKAGRWMFVGRHTTSWDVSTGNFHTESIGAMPEPETQRESVYWRYNNRLFSLNTVCPKDSDFRPGKHERTIESVVIKKPFSLGTYDSFATYLMPLHKTLASLNDCKVEIVAESSKRLLKITGKNVAFFFDLKSDQFTRQDLFWELEDGSRKMVATFEFEYANVDGWLFPRIFFMNFFFGEKQPAHRIRHILSPESVKINKPLNEFAFMPKIPAGAKIRDEINGKVIYASGISEEKREKFIAKELDRIFEEAQKK